MGVNEIATNIETMRKDISELEDLLSMARGTIDKVYAEMTQLDAMWDGDANETFNVQVRKDIEFGREVCDTVNEIINCMEYANSEYNKCENEIGNIIASIRI